MNVFVIFLIHWKDSRAKGTNSKMSTDLISMEICLFDKFHSNRKEAWIFNKCTWNFQAFVLKMFLQKNRILTFDPFPFFKHLSFDFSYINKQNILLKTNLLKFKYFKLNFINILQYNIWIQKTSEKEQNHPNMLKRPKISCLVSSFVLANNHLSFHLKSPICKWDWFSNSSHFNIL